MKAIILAGGAGTRLAPISSDMPKPMAQLPGAPVMEYLVGLLAKHGVRDITAAVYHLPEQIKNHFGDGSSFGVNMAYSLEEDPLGTAGAVRRCVKAGERETLLIISGDAVCDFDLTAGLLFHRQRHALVTLLLHRHPAPMEYGLVLCEQDGRVRRFVEKPSWPQVFGSAVNTGIYILEPSVLDRVPPGKPFDFARDLFPMLLEEKTEMYGFTPGGYWTDIGSCESYLSACLDLLAGKVNLPLPPSETPPPGVETTGPYFIGAGAQIGKGTVLGPMACVESGSVIGEDCILERSVVCGAMVSDATKLTGSVLCSGARVGRGCELREGSVLGSGAVLGEGCVLPENVRVWPNREVARGTILRSSLVSGSLRTATAFSDGGIIRGEAGTQISAEYCARLGGAAAVQGRLGISSFGGNFADSLAQALCAGARGAGCNVYFHDAVNPAGAAFASSLYDFALSMFLEERNSEVSIHFRGSGGDPLSRQSERSIEGALRRGEWKQALSANAGAIYRLSGIREAHICAALAAAPAEAGSIRAWGGTQGCELLYQLFEQAKTPSSGPGTPLLRLEDGGRRLMLRTPDGQEADQATMLLLTGFLLLKSGKRLLALPAGAPFALESLAATFGAEAVWEGSEAYAPALRSCRAMDDGLYAAALLNRALAKNSIQELLAALPEFHSSSRNVPLQTQRGDVMGALCDALGERAKLGRGITCSDRRGFVRITPSSDLAALFIAAEAASAELAEELCVDFTRMARDCDTRQQSENSSIQGVFPVL